MRTSVERLRTGLLVGAGLLVVVLAAFFGYARYKVRHTLASLPGRLGATITKEFNGYTYSQSDGKRTIFTIHAAKAILHTDGTYTLHDVNMVLYGKTGDRADRISGEDFEYDTKAEEVRAAGIVHIDLEAPESASDGEARKHLVGTGGGASDVAEAGNEGGLGNRVVHVKTSGLVYQKKLAVAATSQEVEFAFGGYSGHAIGAEYNSDTGHVVLQSAISVSGIDKGMPVALTASHGELDRGTSEADFVNARYSSAGEVAQAEVAQMHLRKDGSVERIDAQRQVQLAGEGQGVASSDRAKIELSVANRPTAAVLDGNVHFAEDEPLRQVRGESDIASLDFDAEGHPSHTLLHGHVRTSERLPGADATARTWQDRTLTSDDLDLSFAAAGVHGKPLLKEAKAAGLVRMTTVATVSKQAKPAGCGNQPVVSGRCLVTTTTKLSGDTMRAHFIAQHGDAEVSTVHGTGHTSSEQHSSDGVDQVTSGDIMDANFREVLGAGQGVGSPAKTAVELATAVQQGGVAINRSLPGKSKGGAPATTVIQHATARMAAYDVDAGTVTLTGDVRMSETGSTLTADRVVMERDSQNATADGAVKATYLQAEPLHGCAQKSGSAAPIHILAARAEFDHDDSRATFYGKSAAGGPASNSALARMWQAGSAGHGPQEVSQGGSQIEAPVLVIEENNGQERLTARAEKAGVAGQVHAALAYTEKTKPADLSGKDLAKGQSKQKEDGAPAALREGVARITSNQMVYSDSDRQAVFTGAVRLLDSDGEMRAEQATVFLKVADKAGASKQSKPAMSGSAVAVGDAPCPSGAQLDVTGASGTGSLAGSPGILGGDVDRIVATQHVEIMQPGRKATGERLVYTASDQMFVLTGTAAAPPKVVDVQQGTTTGAALRFHSSHTDNSVIVSGRDGDGPAQKVQTETRVKQ